MYLADMARKRGRVCSQDAQPLCGLSSRTLQLGESRESMGDAESSPKPKRLLVSQSPKVSPSQAAAARNAFVVAKPGHGEKGWVDHPRCDRGASPPASVVRMILHAWCPSVLVGRHTCRVYIAWLLDVV